MFGSSAKQPEDQREAHHTGLDVVLIGQDHEDVSVGEGREAVVAVAGDNQGGFRVEVSQLG